MIFFMTAKTFNIWIIFCKFIYSIPPYDIRIWICGGALMIIFAIKWWPITTTITITITTRKWALKTLWFFWQTVFLLIAMISFWNHSNLIASFLFINFSDFITNSHKSLNVVKTFFIFMNTDIWKLKSFNKNSIFESLKCSSMSFFKFLK